MPNMPFQQNYSQPQQNYSQPYTQPNQTNQMSDQSSKGASNASSNNNINFNNLNHTNDNAYTKLEKIKNKGNDFFKEKKFSEANEKYYEVLNEIEYLNKEDLTKYKSEINNLELTTRLNLANTRLKLGDYNLAANECLKVLKSGDNFKAHYRAGLAYYNLKNYDKATSHFLKAKEIGKGEEEESINNYIKEMKPHIDKKQSSTEIKNEEPPKVFKVEGKSDHKPSYIEKKQNEEEQHTNKIKTEEVIKEEQKVKKVEENANSNVNKYSNERVTGRSMYYQDIKEDKDKEPEKVEEKKETEKKETKSEVNEENKVTILLNIECIQK